MGDKIYKVTVDNLNQTKRHGFSFQAEELDSSSIWLGSC